MNTKFEMSADAKIIRSVLAEAAVGDLVTYETLTKAIGRDVRGHATGAMHTALRSVLRDDAKVFGNVRGVGYRRLADGEIIDTSESSRRRIQKESKRAIKRLTCVKFDELGQDQKRQHIAASAQLGAMAHFASKHATKKIESAVQKEDKEMPIGQTLRLFS
jgi:DNA-binding winged helix-turn-helix (wHTH) protein